MKKLIHLVAWLYPAAWRERYGAEFHFLVDDVEPAWTDVLDVVKGGLQMQLMHSSVPVMAAAFGILGILLSAGAGSFAIPDRFVSSGIIGFDAREPVTPREVSKLGGVIHRLAVEALTRAKLAGLIQKYDLYPRKRANQPLEQVVHHMLRSIRIKAFRTDRKMPEAAFEFSFAYPDQRKARLVMAELLGSMIENSHRQRRESQYLATQPVLELIVPPNFPLTPASPNRAAIAGAGLGGGALLGALVALLCRRLSRAAG